MLRPTLRRALPVSIAATVLTATVAVPAQAGADPVPQTLTPGATETPGTTADRIHPVADNLARHVAGALAARADRDRVLARVAEDPVDLLALAPGTALGRSAEVANQSVLRAKGLPSAGGSVLQLRLAHPDMRPALADGAPPLVAASPTDDHVTVVTGYRPDGRKVLLDATELPDRPVLVVEVDVAAALPMGLTVLREELAAHGLRSAPTAGTTADGGYWATKVDAVRLSDDNEPWVKGAAEIFNVVGGFDHDDEPTVDVVQMPYLDHDGTTYYPNQLLVHFSTYQYDLADVVMMEDDGDTNYQALASALISALLVLGGQGQYVPLVNPILEAMPDSWWTDDPDYVDSWYTLSTGSNGRLHGAANNGWLDVTPYFVEEL